MGHYESDLSACLDLFERVAPSFGDLVSVAPGNLNARQMKALIAKTDWFCGTRMHATIAALSSGVPTATIVYSDKARGVFASCGQQAFVFDPRNLERDKIVSGLEKSFLQRDKTKQELCQVIPSVIAQSREPFRRIIELLDTAES